MTGRAPACFKLEMWQKEGTGKGRIHALFNGGPTPRATQRSAITLIYYTLARERRNVQWEVGQGWRYLPKSRVLRQWPVMPGVTSVRDP